MDTYDSGKMKQGAQDILSELGTYSAAKKEMDEVVNNLKNNWKDDTNQNFARKYDSDAKVAMEGVEKLMSAFADTLTSTAEAFEKLHREANNDIG